MCSNYLLVSLLPVDQLILWTGEHVEGAYILQGHIILCVISVTERTVHDGDFQRIAKTWFFGEYVPCVGTLDVCIRMNCANLQGRFVTI